MTLPQALSFGIIAATMVLFAWGRLRYDLVALLSLLAAIATGIVPADKAFSGFSDDIVIIVACALLVSAAVGRSGVVEDALVRIGPYLTTRTIQVAVLVGTVTALSAFVKNIGALAMLMPVAFQLARKTDGSPSIYLMPMAFGSLLGGIVTLVGTSPNIIVARLRGELIGEPFGMFDFTPVGIGLAIAGVVFLSLAWRLLPRDRKAAPRSTPPSRSKAIRPKRACRTSLRPWGRPSTSSKPCRRASRFSSAWSLAPTCCWRTSSPARLRSSASALTCCTR